MINDDGVGALAPAHQLTEDEKRLHELGHKQELRRHMSGFTNFRAVPGMSIRALAEV
jgi:hypothetical protein